MTDTMPEAPSGAVAEQYVTNFRDHGFTHVPNVLTPAEVARFRNAALDTIEREGVAAGMGMGVGRTGIVTTTQAFRKAGILRELARHPRVGAIAEQLAGVPLRVFNGDAQLKPPGDETDTIWHDDLTFAPLRGRILLNAWIALVDVPAERGCMTFVPGSHRRPDPYRVPLAAAKENPNSFLFTGWPELGWRPRLTVPVRAGDATFHQWRVGHTAGPNTSDEARIAFITTYTDAATTYDPHPGLEIPGLVAGEQLSDDDYPLVADFE
ncbi:phytanoyl-CoA dioxygenase family protein [Nocardia suismassiliense]|uniref:Phytanoyl-CoA dioxygenase family protein n=1 Tax=Nocardia suismassiliense TaxID=2077092 RepID=A0ABW6R0A0_9NOCA